MSSDRLTDDFYDRIKPRLYRRIGRELRLAGRVLDLGCGSCDLVCYLAETYRQHVTGVDIAAKKFPKHHPRPDDPRAKRTPRFRCIKANARHLDFVADGSVDAIVSVYAVHEMTYPKAVFREMHRVLRPGGEVLVVDFPRGSLADKLWKEKYCSPDEIVGMMEQAKFCAVKAKLIESSQLIWAKGFCPSIMEAAL